MEYKVGDVIIHTIGKYKAVILRLNPNLKGGWILRILEWTCENSHRTLLNNYKIGDEILGVSECFIPSSNSSDQKKIDYLKITSDIASGM